MALPVSCIFPPLAPLPLGAVCLISLGWPSTRSDEGLSICSCFMSCRACLVSGLSFPPSQLCGAWQCLAEAMEVSEAQRPAGLGLALLPIWEAQGCVQTRLSSLRPVRGGGVFSSLGFPQGLQQLALGTKQALGHNLVFSKLTFACWTLLGSSV